LKLSDGLDPQHTAWLALKRSIEQVVPLEPSSIRLGERDFTWYRVADPEVLLEAAVADGERPREELDPFWSVTWRAAQGLDRFLADWELPALRMLELGCGSGQAGTGAAARGAHVTLTDAVELALQVARLNAWPVAERMQFRRLKWGAEQLTEPKFPVIIGSDLVYDPQLFPSLEACARQHLAPGGTLLLSEPFRHTGDHFAKWIVAAGWQQHEHAVDLGDGRVPIRIFECELL
jgi:predicted nicotinamide N-methyase